MNICEHLASTAKLFPEKEAIVFEGHRFTFSQIDQMSRSVALLLTESGVTPGDRIAIMRDGQIIQVGTPEQIVLEPADDYVADFVAGISRLKVVRAHAVMQPLAAYEAEHGALEDDLPSFAAQAHLGELIEATIAVDKPACIVDESGQRIGVVTRVDLLKTVIEGTETS